MLEYNHWKNVSTIAWQQVYKDMEALENSLFECNEVVVKLLEGDKSSSELVNNIELSKLAGDWLPTRCRE